MTTVQNACKTVIGFEILYKKFLRRMSINDRALSTSTSYGRSLANIALHYNRLPTLLSLDEIEEYLFLIKNKADGDSYNAMKFAIYSLRFVYRMEGLDEIRLQLPVIRKKRKLPVVLSKLEMAAMINSPSLLSHRVMIALLYGCGLRCGEVRNIKVTDVDLDRYVLHVRQSKGRKDRYLPLGNSLSDILKYYINIKKPVLWLFSGGRHGSVSNRFFPLLESQFGQRSIQWAIKRAAHLAGILKKVSVHSLRHTYATHLLEDGVNILTIRELLGHADIRTTMIYLHVAQINNKNKCSPLDTLEGVRAIGCLQTALF